jgi:septum formation protein
MILEKPRDDLDAKRMLRLLSGREHHVVTGMCLITPGNDNQSPHVKSFCEMTKVKFADLSDELIDAYVKTREPMDKAGSYGIQGIGGSIVEKIEGCYFNVMGLPLHHFCKELVKIIKTQD